jgi:ABC-type transport system involved in multi-copper enzyme maturation permease subunit
MKHTNMTWLVWKEYRQNRLIVWAMLFFLILPYLAWPVMAFVVWRWNLPLDRPGPRWLFWFGETTYVSFCISQLAMALIGGNAIAGERIDRSEQFQACLPIPRVRILTAKLLLALLMFAVIWVPFLPFMGGLWFGQPKLHLREIQAIANVALTGLTFFCVAWFFSSLLGSSAVAVCAGVVTPFLAWTLPLLAMWAQGFERYAARNVDSGAGYIPLSQSLLVFWAYAICLTLCPVCFALGTWLYLRRAEP